MSEKQPVRYELIDKEGNVVGKKGKHPMRRPERVFYWKWPVDGQAWFAWAFQNYGSKWIVWRVGPLNYRVQVAGPGEKGGWIGRPEKQSAR